MPELTVGSPAPAFRSRRHAAGRDRDIPGRLPGQILRRPVLLPKDDTPGCTTESCAFRDQYADFQAAGSAILGISPDDQASHVKFAEKYALPFPLLADPDHQVAEAYGVWKEKNNYGKKYMGIERTTFVIDKEGKIAKVYPRVKVDQHADNVLEFVKTL